MDDWELCSRCGIAPAVHDIEAAEKLCRSCHNRMEEVGAAAASLAATLMDWGRLEEWAGREREILLEAAELALYGFQLRIGLDNPLSEGPRLLSTVMEGGEVSLTVGLTSKVVWRETFGTWDSGHPRVIFLTAISDLRRVGETISVYFWDRESDKCATRTVWTSDDETAGEFNEVVRTRRWGAPKFNLRVDGIPKDDLEAVSGAVMNVASALGLHPHISSWDKATGSVTTELFGELTDVRRRDIPLLLRHMLDTEKLEVSFESFTTVSKP